MAELEGEKSEYPTIEEFVGQKRTLQLALAKLTLGDQISADAAKLVSMAFTDVVERVRVSVGFEARWDDEGEEEEEEPDENVEIGIDTVNVSIKATIGEFIEGYIDEKIEESDLRWAGYPFPFTETHIELYLADDTDPDPDTGPDYSDGFGILEFGKTHVFDKDRRLIDVWEKEHLVRAKRIEEELRKQQEQRDVVEHLEQRERERILRIEEKLSEQQFERDVVEHLEQRERERRLRLSRTEEEERSSEEMRESGVKGKRGARAKMVSIEKKREVGEKGKMGAHEELISW